LPFPRGIPACGVSVGKMKSRESGLGAMLYDYFNPANG
jgi:hypothetical protein